jgi:tetratricopeptide (TPR) repeat protein
LFEEAAELDPHYARGYAGMSRTFNHAWLYRWTDAPDESLDRAIALALEAVKRDEIDARGHSELGYAHLYAKHHEASLASYERAIQLNPNDADILADMADALTYSDRAEQAIQLLQRAMRLNPFYPDWYLWHLGEAYFHIGEYEKTVETYEKMRSLSEGHRMLAATNALLGRMDEARSHARQVLTLQPDFSIAHWQTVPPYKSPELLKRFIEGLRLAGLK